MISALSTTIHSTVSYLGGDQQISDVDYYNMTVGGGTLATPAMKQTANFDFNVINDFTIADYTSFTMDAHTLLVQGDFTMSTLGAFVFTDDGFLVLEGATDATFDFSDGFGTVIYQGDAGQLLAGGDYNNLEIANGVKELGATVRVLNTFSFADDAGRLDLGTYDIYLNGAISNSSGTDGRYFANTTTSDSGEVFLMAGS